MTVAYEIISDQTGNPRHGYNASVCRDVVPLRIISAFLADVFLEVLIESDIIH